MGHIHSGTWFANTSLEYSKSIGYTPHFAEKPHLLNSIMPNTQLILKKDLQVLIADDDNDDIAFFQESLHEIAENIKVSVVHNGIQLMEFLHILRPDIIFLDINMPCKTGLECLAEIREIEKLSRMPIVIYSTANNSKQIEKTLELGANLYFEKPISLNGMKAGLTKILSYTPHTLLSELPRAEYLIKA